MNGGSARLRGLVAGLAPLLAAGCVGFQEAPAEESGCRSDAACAEGEICLDRRCQVKPAPVELPVGAPCEGDSACATQLCVEHACCDPSCEGLGCGERPCRAACTAGCAFVDLGAAAPPTCGTGGWPAARDSSPLARLGETTLALFSGSAGNDDRGFTNLWANDLWLLDVDVAQDPPGASWTQVAQAAAWPAPRDGQLFVGLDAELCSAHGVTPPCALLFGGRLESSRTTDDSWLLSRDDGFVPLDLPGPPPRFFAAFRSLGPRVVLFGGYSGASADVDAYQTLADSWIFDATGWHEVATVAGEGPPGRARAGLVGPLPDGRLLLLGGTPGLSATDPAELAPLWAFDGDRWSAASDLPASPTARQAGSWEYAPGPGLLLSHGGAEVLPSNGIGVDLLDGEWLDLQAAAPGWTRFVNNTARASLAFRAAALVDGGGLVLFGGWGEDLLGTGDDPTQSCRLQFLRLP